MSESQVIKLIVAGASIDEAEPAVNALRKIGFGVQLRHFENLEGLRACLELACRDAQGRYIQAPQPSLNYDFGVAF